MGHKISPTSFRIGIQKDWPSRWFGGKKYVPYLKDDLAVRKFLGSKLKNMGIDKIEMDRGADALNIVIYTARPGLLIGRGGGGIEDLKNGVRRFLKNKLASFSIGIPAFLAIFKYFDSRGTPGFWIIIS